MTMSRQVPAICPQCGRKQYYEILLTWNSFCNTPISNNKCICEHQLTRNDINVEECDTITKYILSD